MVSSYVIWFLDLAPGQIWPREQFQRLLPEVGCDPQSRVVYVEHECISNLRYRVLKPHPRCAMLAMSGAWSGFFQKTPGLRVAETWTINKNIKKTRLKDCYGSKQRWKSQVCCTTVWKTSAVQPTEVQPFHCVYPDSTRGCRCEIAWNLLENSRDRERMRIGRYVCNLLP